MKAHLTPAQMRVIFDLGWTHDSDMGRVAWLVREVVRLRAELEVLKALLNRSSNNDML
jgi:hypothetical protein